MNIKYILVLLASNVHIMQCFGDNTSANLEILKELLAQEMPDYIALRAPVTPDSLGDSLGSLNYKGYNNASMTGGAKIEGYYGIPGSGIPSPNVTMPGSIGIATVPTAASNIIARLLVSATGFVGIGNFIPGTGTNNGLPNAILNVEGDNTASANSALHVGSRVTAITGLTSNVAYSAQVDGNFYDAGFSRLSTDLTVMQHLNAVQTTFIHQSDIGATGYAITTPGRYVVAENLTQTTGSPIISISAAASGSVVDLNDFVLTAGTGGGITVATSTNNLTIKNGTIQNAATNGISLVNSALFTMQNVNFVNCAQFAFLMAGGADSINILIENCGAYNCGTDITFANSAGFRLTEVNTATLRNIKVVSCGNSSQNFSGIQLGIPGSTTSASCVVEKCLVAQNTGLAVTGFSITAPRTILRDCDCSNNTALAGMTGILLTNAVLVPFGAQLYNCIATCNSGSSIAGFVHAGNSKLVNCIACNNTTSGFARGFYMSSTNSPYVYLLNCIAYDNTTTVAANAGIGIAADVASAHILERSISFGNGGTGATGSMGISAATTSTIVVSNNTSFGNQSNYNKVSALGVFSSNVSCFPGVTGYLGLAVDSRQQAAPTSINNLTVSWTNINVS